MRHWGSLVLVIVLSAPAWGFSSAKLDVNTEDLKDQADEVVEVNLDGKALQEGSKLLAIRSGISNSVKSLLGGIKGIYRKTYRFAAGNSPEDDAVQNLRSQITEGGWSPMIDVQDRKQKKALTVYSFTSTDGAPNGVAVVSSDPGEITVLNLVGDIDLDALADVGETLGLPSMRLATTELGTTNVPLPPKPENTQQAQPKNK